MKRDIDIPLVIISGIGLACVLAIAGGIYIGLNGTPWGRISAEHQLMASLDKEYTHEKFHQVGYAGWVFDPGEYEVNIVFNRLPWYTYGFTMQDGKAVMVWSSGSHNGHGAPYPYPYATFAKWWGR